MATICSPVLLVGRERIVYVGRAIRICAVPGTQSSIDVACEGNDQQGEYQSKKDQDRNNVNRGVSFGRLGGKCCHIEDLLLILILLMIFVGTMIE
jgi:hypothetical protein